MPNQDPTYTISPYTIYHIYQIYVSKEYLFLLVKCTLYVRCLSVTAIELHVFIFTYARWSVAGTNSLVVEHYTCNVKVPSSTLGWCFNFLSSSFGFCLVFGNVWVGTFFFFFRPISHPIHYGNTK